MSPSLKLSSATAEAKIGGAAVSFSATLEGATDEVVWALVPELGTLSDLTGLETTYTPPESAATPASVVLTATAGDLSAFAFISLTSVPASAHVVYVNPQTGVDTNDGSENAPLKTIRRALTRAEAGSTVDLAGGVYSEASGESYLEVTDGLEGYLVAEAVEIRGVSSDGVVPVVIRNDGNPRDAFRFAGSGKLSGVRLEGFKRGVVASVGTQLLHDVTMLGMGEFAVALDGTAHLSCTGCDVSVARGVAFNLADDARLRVDGASSINSSSPAYEPFLVAVHLVEEAQGEALLDFKGGVSRGSHAVNGGKLTLNDVDVHLRNKQQDLIFVGPEGKLSMFDGRVTGGYLAGGGDSMLALSSYGTLTVNGTVFEDNPGGSMWLDGGSADIRNAVFRNIGDPDVVFQGHGLNAIVVDGEAALKMRGSQIHNVKEAGNYTPPTLGTHGTGIYVADASGGVDLGTEASPGRNHFHDCGFTALSVSQSAGDRTIQAVGNTWTPDEQGADEEGRYGARLVDQGSYGSNFHVPASGSIQF